MTREPWDPEPPPEPPPEPEPEPPPEPPPEPEPESPWWETSTRRGGMADDEGLALALEWAEQSFPAFPCGLRERPGGGGVLKRPLMVHGHVEATTDPAELARLFAPERLARWLAPGEELGVGIVPGPAGYVVLDCDVKDGKPGLDTLERLQAVHGDFARCYYRSASGGRNVILRKPEDATFGNTEPKGPDGKPLWPGVEIRSDSGWIVAPGTWCSSGKWELEYGEVADAVEIPAAMATELREAHKAEPTATTEQARAWLADNAGPTTPAARGLFTERLAAITEASKGARHGALLSVMGWVIGMRNLDHAEALIAVREAWDRVTAGEGRGGEPIDVLLWTIGQEQAKREREAAADGEEQSAGSEAKGPAGQQGARTAPPLRLAPWPTLDPTAHYGIVGEIVAALAPYSEADPAGMIVDLLAAIGNIIGAGPHVHVGGLKHPGRIFPVKVGRTAKGRKGQGWADVLQVLSLADPLWAATQIINGISTGEGLIAFVSDPPPTDEGDKAPPAADPAEPASGDGIAWVPVRSGKDHRVLVVESEYARVLAVVSRDGATISHVLRDAWDTGNLAVLTRKDPLRASGAHISLIGHITLDELRAKLTSTEIANGFGNRFLFACVTRQRLLPEGGQPPHDVVTDLARRLAAAIDGARKRGEVRRAPEGAKRWAVLYAEMADDEADGILGALTARAEAQVLRLSFLHAVLDGGDIDVAHIDAAWALWRYCRDSVAHIFGDTLGDEVADRLLGALRSAGAEGLTGTEVRALFSNHVNAKRIAAARALLEAKGLARAEEEPTGGRPVTRLIATDFLR